MSAVISHTQHSQTLNYHRGFPHRHSFAASGLKEKTHSVIYTCLISDQSPFHIYIANIVEAQGFAVAGMWVKREPLQHTFTISGTNFRGNDKPAVVRRKQGYSILCNYTHNYYSWRIHILCYFIVYLLHWQVSYKANVGAEQICKTEYNAKSKPRWTCGKIPSKKFLSSFPYRNSKKALCTAAWCISKSKSHSDFQFHRRLSFLRIF